MLGSIFSPAQRRAVCGVFLICVAVALVAYPQQSMQAARAGLVLCGETIVPSLFPFFVLSGMVMELGIAQYLGRFLERFMWPLFRVNGAGAAALVLGLVGGYPVGARTAIELYQKGHCSQKETERLLAFCNNSGPAFIFGVVGAGVFGSSRVGVVLYLIHVVASVCVGLLFRFYGSGVEKPCKVPNKTTGVVGVSAAFTASIRTAVSGVLNICAFVVTFAVLIRLLLETGVMAVGVGVLERFGVDARQAQSLLSGFLEVSSGVSGLAGDGKLVLAAFMLGWAGLCVHCQVLCFFADSGLRVKTYLLGKLLHGALSALFAMWLGRLFPQSLAVGGWQEQQLEQVVGVGFAATLALSVSVAWLVWFGCLLVMALVSANMKKGVEKGGELRYNRPNLPQEGMLCPNCFKRKSNRTVPIAPTAATSASNKWFARKRV